MTEERLNEVETNVTFHEESLRELTKTVLQLQKRVTQLEDTCRLLVEKMRQLSDKEPSVGPHDDRPPHY